ncbi:MAG: helix-turn-helix transcriptional regulator [Ferruginibacter sp.]
MFRRCSGYSQKKVARILGLADTSTLSRWEHGMAFPSIVQTFRLAHIYQTLPQELFDEMWNRHGTEISLVTQHTEPIIGNESFYL